MAEPSLKKQTFNGVIWRILETGGDAGDSIGD